MLAWQNRADGALDRAQVAARVFRDPAALERVAIGKLRRLLSARAS